MSDVSSKTPRILVNDFISNVKTKSGSPPERHLPVDGFHKTPTDDVRRSPRFVGMQPSVQKSDKAKSKRYPGSATKSQSRRSFRTPVQTLSLQGDGRGTVSKSFVVAPDEFDMDTPRSNIEAYLAVAESVPPAHRSIKKTPQKSAVTSSINQPFKAPKTPGPVSKQQISSPALDKAATPGSKFTPRTNIWNLLYAVTGREQTPAERTEDESQRRSKEFNKSAVKPSGLGQEVSLSPMYISHTSEGRESSPSMSWKLTRRTRRSFHIPEPQPTKEGEDGLDNRSSINKQRQDKSRRDSSNSSVDDDPDITEDVDGNLEGNVDKDKEDKSKRKTSDNERGDINGFQDSPLEQNGMSRNKSAIHEEIAAVPTITDESGTQHMLEGVTETEMRDDIEESSSNAGEMGLENGTGLNKSVHRSLMHEEMPSVQTNQNAEKENGDVRTESSAENEGANNDEINAGTERDMERIAASLSYRHEKVTSESHTDEAEDDGRRDKTFDKTEGGNDDESINSEKERENSYRIFKAKAASLSESRDEITPVTTPVKNQTATVDASVYDLSSGSSSDKEVTNNRARSSEKGSPKKRRSGTASAQRRRSGSRGSLSPAKASKSSAGHSEISSSIKKFRQSYGEWRKSQQGEKKNVSDTITGSFLHEPRSSTPHARIKRIFSSTRRQSSMLTLAPKDHISAALEASPVGPISDISPIRADSKAQRQRYRKEGQEALDITVNGEFADTEVGTSRRGTGGGHTEKTPADQHSSEDELSDGLSPLDTPHINLNKKRQVSTVDQFARQKSVKGSAMKQTQKRKGPTNDKQPSKRARKVPSTALPRRSVKFFAERHSTMKLSKDAVEEIEKASEIFWDDTFKALEAYALHAGRKIINEQDVILLMKTQRLIKGKEDLHDRIREFLPMELRMELIPVAKP